MIRQILLRLALVFCAAGMLVLAFESARERHLRAAARGRLEQTLDNLEDRVRLLDRNRRSAAQLLGADNLARARALALLVEEDPSILSDTNRLEQVRAQLAVDEVCVSDGRGVLVASLPQAYVGYRMDSQLQSAAFMPAVTNRHFELAQEPMPRGINGSLFQYAGVARRDAPGVVQVGVGVERLRMLQELAGEDTLRRTSRVRRGGFVAVVPSKAEPAKAVFSEETHNGQNVLLGRVVCCGRQITVAEPMPSGFLAHGGVFALVALAALAFLLAVLRVLVPDLRRVTAAQVRSVVYVVCAAGVLALAFASASARIDKEEDGERLLMVLENVTERVRSAFESAQMAARLTKAGFIVRARAFAMLLAGNPSILNDSSRLDFIRQAFDADELTVSDDRGVLVAAYPEIYCGYRLDSSEQSAVFMPAITNQSFELVQDPAARGFDGRLFQYACVARRDQPGVLSVGFETSRLAHVMGILGMDEVDDIVRGRGEGFVDIAPTAPKDPRRGYFIQRWQGRSHLCLAAPCADRFVTVGIPATGGWLALPSVSITLAVLAALFFLGVLGTLVPGLAATVSAYARAFGMFFWGLRADVLSALVPGGTPLSFRRMLALPVVLVCLGAFLFASGVAWLMQSEESERTSRRQLCSQVQDSLSDLSNTVDNMMFAIGRAICRHYRMPGALNMEEAQKLANRYDIDEVSVVDERGISVYCNTVDTEYDMASSPTTRAFNCLLAGAQTFVQPFRESVDEPGVVRKYAGVAFPDAPGYMQLGIDQRRLVTDLRYLFTDLVRKTSVGMRGFLLWTESETGRIVANGSPEAHLDDTLASIGFNAVTAPGPGVPFQASFYGQKCLAVWQPYANLRLYAVLPQSEVSSLRGMWAACSILFVVFVAFALFATRLTALVTHLKAFIAAEHDRQKSDMAMAKTIQMSSLPVSFPDTPSFKIFARMDTAREVGGDFYDFYGLPDGREVFLIADVSGKGVPAAMFMMKAKAILRAAMAEREELDEAVSLANERLAAENDAEMFVTAWIGVLDLRTGRVSYINAGHNPPLVHRADGSVDWIRGRRSLVLAAMPGMRYAVQEMALAPGESLLLYTDGVTEAVDPVHNLYGEARLEAALRKAGPNFVTEIRADVDVFAGGAEQADDITMLALDFRSYAV